MDGREMVLMALFVTQGNIVMNLQPADKMVAFC